jgi:hypothetical protein
VGLEIILAHIPKHWDFRLAPPCPAYLFVSNLSPPGTDADQFIARYIFRKKFVSLFQFLTKKDSLTEDSQILHINK